MVKMLLPGATIGIIGAGQLGKMLGQAALKMGYKVAMLDPNPQACGFGVCHWFQVSAYDDLEAVMAFIEKVDVVTYEFENINAEILDKLANTNKLPQGIRLLQISQHRLSEKEALKQLEIPVVDFEKLLDVNDLDKINKKIGFPYILKTTRLGYDGKGQLLIRDENDQKDKLSKIVELLESECIIEAYCPFDFEVSVMVARDQYGEVEVFPISWNQHQAGVLFSSVVPATINDEMSNKITQIATKIAHFFDLVGVCGIEFFITNKGDVLVNELAPRPHNSGHYSIEACDFSQYDQHILAITGRQIVKVNLLKPVLMINLLGQHLSLLPEAFKLFPNAMFHLYDKGEAKSQRKLGHFTLLVESVDQAEQWLEHPYLKNWKELFNQ